MREYGIMVLKFRSIYDAVFENRLVRYFLRAIPSLAELVVLGKILHEVRLEEGGLPRWDVVVLDAPATGHAVQLLRVPATLLDTVPPGPLRRDAQWMRDLLVDPLTTSLSIVTLPEEERARFGELELASAPLGPAAQAARLQALRADQASRYLARARAALDLPTILVPLLARERWDLGAVEEVAQSLAGSV